MKPFSLPRTLLVAAIMSQSPLVMAQSFPGYDGPAVDYNFVFNKPDDHQVCEKYKTLEEYKVCEKGREKADDMAGRFAGGYGKMAGYLRGYSWGLYKAVDAFEDNATEMERGGQSVDTLSGHLQTGINAGIRQGRADGNPRGAQDARQRFHESINTNQLPSGEYSVPTTHYEGEDNAYRRYVGQVPSAEQLLKEDNAKPSVWGQLDDTLMTLPDNRNAWNYYFGDGTYRFETNYWDQGTSALNAYLRRLDNGYYGNLGSVTRTVTNQDGTTTNVVVDLKNVFKDAFVASYGYYANYFFSLNFKQSIAAGQEEGYKLGTQVGKRVAFNKGLAKAFDRKFKESSRASYRSAFEEAYSGSFEDTFNDYLNNPKLDVELIEVLGMDDDGIIQPGEEFALQYRITNFGGVGTNLSASVSGDVLNGQTYSNESVSAITSKVITTGIIGQVDPRLRPREQANITLNVNGVTDTYGQVVNQLVEVRSLSSNLNVVAGAGQVTIKVTNLATVQTPSSVSAELVLNGRTYTAIAGQLGAGSSRNLVLSFEDLDPLDLLTEDVRGEVFLKHGSKVLERAPVVLRTRDQIGDTIKYFDKLANGGSVPAGVNFDDRIADVKTLLANLNKREVEKHSKRGGYNVYRKDPGSTVPGKIALQFEAGNQSPEAIEQYHSLAKILIKERKKFKTFLWIIKPKRTHYTKQVRRFAKTKIK